MKMSRAAPISVAPEDRVPFGTKLAYVLGGPVDILAVWVMVSIAYPFFNMDLKMRPLYVSIILMSLRAWDGIIDPLMGCISDNFRSKWGRRRPFIVLGGFLLAASFIAIWFMPQSWSERYAEDAPAAASASATAEKASAEPDAKPESAPITGVPQAMHSMNTRPKGSRYDGKQPTSAQLNSTASSS